MYEIKLTLNISRKLYSLVKNGVELVRSLSLVKAKTLLNELIHAYGQKAANPSIQNNQNGIQENWSTSRNNNTDDRSVNCSCATSSIQPSQSRNTFPVDSVDRDDSYAICKSESLPERSQLCIKSKSIATREDSDRQTKRITATQVRQLEFCLEAIRELSHRQHEIVLDQHEIVLDQHEIVCETAAIARFALGLVPTNPEKQLSSSTIFPLC